MPHSNICRCKQNSGINSFAVSPNFSENSTTSVITTTGASATLECYADGYPQPRISWRRQNNDLLPTGEIIYQGNVLNISNVTKNDRGIYFCVANNRVSRKARKIPVDVEYAPLVTIERPRQDHVLRNRVDLRCKVEAFPQPSTIWLKDGYAIKDNQLFTISIFSTADDQVDTTLRILATEKKRYGNYTCKATNKLGSAESTVELYGTSLRKLSREFGFSGWVGKGGGTWAFALSCCFS